MYMTVGTRRMRVGMNGLGVVGNSDEKMRAELTPLVWSADAIAQKSLKGIQSAAGVLAPEEEILHIWSLPFDYVSAQQLYSGQGNAGNVPLISEAGRNAVLLAAQAVEKVRSAKDNFAVKAKEITGVAPTSEATGQAAKMARDYYLSFEKIQKSGENLLSKWRWYEYLASVPKANIGDRTMDYAEKALGLGPDDPNKKPTKFDEVKTLLTWAIGGFLAIRLFEAVVRR